MFELKEDFISLTENTRLHKSPVPVIGLTGGIASGKSTVSHRLKDRGLFIIDADQLIKNIYQNKDVIKQIAKLIPSVINDKKIDFKALRSWAFENSKNIKSLESLLYPHLPGEFHKLLKSAPGQRVVIYDVPLLFEKSLNTLVDFKVCVYIPQSLQAKRLKDRDQTPDKEIEVILGSQLDIEKKKTLSDYVIDNSGSKNELDSEVDKFINFALIKRD